MSSHHDSGHHGHTHHHSPQGRVKARPALLVALVILAATCGLEAVTGVLTGSLALLSDAGHLLTDVGAVALALLAGALARRPASSRRSFGLRRAEILAALVNGLTLWGVAGVIVVEGARRLLAPPPVNALPMIAVASVGLVAQVAAAAVLARADRTSLNVRAAYLHALTDAFQSLGVVGSGIAVHLTGLLILDPIVSIAIGIGIFWSASRVVAEAAHVLLEGTPHSIDLSTLHQAMRAQVGVREITDLHAWSLTSGYNALSAHVVGDEGLSAEQRETLCLSLVTMLEKDFPLQHVTLQVEASCPHGESHECSTKWMSETRV